MKYKISYHINVIAKKPSLGGGIKKLQAQLNEINKVNAPLIATPVTFDLSFLNKPVVTK